MKTLKGDPSPVCDGFTVFWHDLRPQMTKDPLNASFGNTLSSSLQLAIVKLLRKGQKDPTLPGNYRPIPILSIIFKLASACITNLIKPAVSKIIDK